MAEDVLLPRDEPANPCCSRLKEKYTKLREKQQKWEQARDALRQTVKILDQELSKLQNQNTHLQKEFDQERIQANNEKQEKEKESALRVSLESEILVLKSEILSSQQKGNTVTDDATNELKNLRSLVSDGEMEIKKLKELLEIERARADSEKLKAEAERKNANEARKLLKAENEKKENGSALCVSLETEISVLKSEILSLQKKGNMLTDDATEELKSLRLRISDGEMEIHKLKELLEKEGARADSEKSKAEAERKKANEAHKLVKAEKGKADEERRVANIEKRKAEDIRLQLETVKSEADKARSRLALEISKNEKANRKLEAEKQNTLKEKKRAEMEMAKAQEQRKHAEMVEKKSMDEQRRADHLSQELEQCRHRIQELQKEMHELVSLRQRAEVFTGLIDKNVAENLQLEHLKSDEADRDLEVLKIKVIRETKRADSERRKADEQRKIAENYRKESMKQKIRADQVALELDEYKKRVKQLQKVIKELELSRTDFKHPHVESDKDLNAGSAKMKLLRKKLKFEKMQTEHHKQVAKLEIGRNNILKQELCHLKQELIQFSLRLNTMENYFSHSNEGTDDPAKIGSVCDVQSLSLKRQMLTNDPYVAPFYDEHGLRILSCTKGTAVDTLNPLKQPIECTGPVLPPCGGKCTVSISGINSKLGPLLRGSNRKMLQTSAINSSTASFSDRPLLGSQEEGSFSVTTSDHFAEENSNLQLPKSRLSGEAAKLLHNENHAVVAENSVRSPSQLAVKKKDGSRKKRKRILDAVETIEHMYAEGQKWNLVIGEKLSVLHDIIDSRMERNAEEGRCLVSNSEQDLCGKMDRSFKKRKVSEDGIDLRQHLPFSSVQKDSPGTKCIEEVNACSQNLPSSVYIVGECAKTCRNDSLRTNLEVCRQFHEVVHGNYMKLLDLDDEIDEDRYRLAIEMPLSPTLPAIELRGAETMEVDASRPLVDESCYEGFQKITDGMVSCCDFDVINVETDYNKLKLDDSFSSHFPLLQKNHSDLFEDSVNADCHTASVSASVKQGVSTLRNERQKIPSDSSLGNACNVLPDFFVVYLDTRDEGSISRLFCATKSCKNWCSMIQADGMVQTILLALAKAEDLLAKEKACVLFSLLLQDLSGIVLGNVSDILDNDLVLSFAGDMHAVMFDVEMRNLFLESFHLDELLSFIEDFLTDRRVLVYRDAFAKPLLCCSSESKTAYNGLDVRYSIQMASSQQLVAGCIILASICAAVDHIGFVCEASCNIFLMQRLDSSLMLIILHIFAHLCGYKYFAIEDYHLTMSVVKSLVTFLEKETLSGHSPCNINSCTKCPFSEGAVAMEKVVLQLMEKLRNHSLPGMQCEDTLQTVNSVNSGALSTYERTKQSASSEQAALLQYVNCEVSCCLNKFGMPDGQSNSVVDESLCCSDVLSLLELVACFMSWDWTFDKIVSQLLEMLESCVQDNFAAAIVILLGKLGRLGIDANGYEDKGVQNLRHQLSAFLGQTASSKSGLLTQMATAASLIVLLPLKFEELVKGDALLPAQVDKSDPANCIRKWFSLLSSEQKSLSSRLLQPGRPVAEVNCS